MCAELLVFVYLKQCHNKYAQIPTYDTTYGKP